MLEPEQRATGLDVLVCGRRLTLAIDRPLELGRDDDCETADVFRASTNVSRKHAVLRWDGARLFVMDVESRNGTFVNGQRLPVRHEYELRHGQTLRLASNVSVEIQWER